MIDIDGELSVCEQCQLLDVARSTYYKQRASESGKNIGLMRRIDGLYTADPTLGSRKMRDRLRIEGHSVNRKCIQRLMRIMGLQVIYPKRHLSRALAGAKVYPYLLRDMTIVRPNQVWYADITYIRLSHGFMYLVAIRTVIRG